MKILLLTPPLTQLNTPYPATPYLKGFLEQEGHEVMQADLGIELVNRLFSRQGLDAVFGEPGRKVPQPFRKMLAQKQQYLDTIDAVMRFLQGKEPSLATRICNTDWLPRGARFRNMADIDWAFGTMGNTEMARHIATLYIQDIADFIREIHSPHFELIRYAEHLCLHLPGLDPLLQELEKSHTLPDTLLLELLHEKMRNFQPDVVGISIPFPGNLMGAFLCSRFIRKNYPKAKVVWGGGYVNTELRQLQDQRVFEFAHYICLDDGEPAWRGLVRYLEDGDESHLCQTFYVDQAGELRFMPARPEHHIPFRQVPAPDYSDLPLNKYISLIDVANPMHKLWSDGRWNKLTLAHGCYWAKCAFCDTSLPYIRCYDPLKAEQICDYMEKVMAQTDYSGFHFTDEAAPPALLRQLSEEIIRRKMVVSWWTNIRFEKAFTVELCYLMARAGCIAVSGGVEVASNRLLKLINKGVTVEQAFETARNLSQHGIMVHAYLMYGFPTQTQQETLQGLEVVRQMFEQGVLQSAFWHRFAMTLHSPSGMEPQKYGARHLPHTEGSFANNEIPFADNQDISYDLLGEALRVATYNYMHGAGFDWPVKKWLKVATDNLKKTQPHHGKS
ncbi:MAG: radical SAM protein [Bacteroidetes bacterium]|nr:MAG: radical SAM protein [Bacteroidota bacterium]